MQRERCEDPREYIDQSPRGLGGSSPLLGKLFVNDKEEHLPTPGPIISHHQPKGSPHEEKKNFVNSANNVHIVNIAFSLFVDIWILFTNTVLSTNVSTNIETAMLCMYTV